MKKEKVIAVIPAYNEEKTVAEIVRKTRKYVDKVIVVDDCSADRTGKLAKEAGAEVIRHETNGGLGRSLKTGFEGALKEKADVVISIDADGQHRPEDIPRFLKALEGADFVIGKRDISKYPAIKKFGNWGLRGLTNLICGTKIVDTESGYRAIRAELLKKMHLSAERYEIAVDIVYEAAKNKAKIREISIESPVYVKGVGTLDGFKNGWFAIKKRMRG